MPRAPRRRGGGRGRPSPRRAVSSPSPTPSEEEPRPPFFGTTFTTHRVSPLHIGGQPDDTTYLQTLGDRLRDTLIGDVVRGVYVGLDPGQGELGKAGSLESVSLRWIQIRDLFSKTDHDRRSPSLGSDAPVGIDALGALASKRGIWIDIQYENAECTGVLLPDLSEEDDRALPDQTWAASSAGGQVDPSHFVQLPLLLLRMPTPLKNIVVDWLASAFDCRINSLTLGTRSLVSILEMWLRDAALPSRGVSGKEIVLTIGFSLPQPRDAAEVDEDEEAVEKVQMGIRSIDVTIAPGDVQRFVRAGKAIALESDQTRPTLWTGDAKTRKWLAGGNDDDGWGWKQDERRDGVSPQPFMDAVARYLDHHLALNLFHPCVRITKVASPGFVLTESRVKVFETEDAKSVGALLGDVTARSMGSDLPSVF
ncbi:uncharacterized protein DNG_04141 [Cephalotrichum gorgonifer]|uniref:Siroheme synthase n=1 Tax=Cephalotrichum gorgonifer TaxID=2041049 RepID=A0AAE8SUM0_9PEZI|nr:uncharacterized protein DNG_04141 [Cephalotrichum gorgonifer]